MVSPENGAAYCRWVFAQDFKAWHVGPPWREEAIKEVVGVALCEPSAMEVEVDGGGVCCPTIWIEGIGVG